VATESIRKQAVAALVAQIAVVNGPSATYFKDLTGDDQVSSLLMTSDQRSVLEHDNWVYVYDGTESIEGIDVIGETFESTLEFLVVCLVRSESTDTPMLEELNDLLHDVMLAVGIDTSLGGLVSGLRVTSIETPVYNSQDSEGLAVIHALCTYDFETGSTI